MVEVALRGREIQVTKVRAESHTRLRISGSVRFCVVIVPLLLFSRRAKSQASGIKSSTRGPTHWLLGRGWPAGAHGNWSAPTNAKSKKNEGGGRVISLSTWSIFPEVCGGRSPGDRRRLPPARSFCRGERSNPPAQAPVVQAFLKAFKEGLRGLAGTAGGPIVEVDDRLVDGAVAGYSLCQSF